MEIVKFTHARSGLTSLFDRVLDRRERIVIQRHGRERIALIPFEDLEALQRLEDEADVAAADAAMAEPGESIPYDQIRKDLGL
jgi:PHD/YefM family antitoxin component YafN of YafNO toxin-antitoxin module